MTWKLTSQGRHDVTQALPWRLYRSMHAWCVLLATSQKTDWYYARCDGGIVSDATSAQSKMADFKVTSVARGGFFCKISHRCQQNVAVVFCYIVTE